MNKQLTCKNCEYYDRYSQTCNMWFKKVGLNDYCEEFENNIDINPNNQIE
jgi:hypothetical protein